MSVLLSPMVLSWVLLSKSFLDDDNLPESSHSYYLGTFTLGYTLFETKYSYQPVLNASVCAVGKSLMFEVSGPKIISNNTKIIFCKK